MKLRGQVALVFLGLASWGLSGPVRADEGKIAGDDFLADAIIRAGWEVRACELALEHGKAKEVQQFARKVLAQQRKLDPPLNRLAWGNKVPVLFNQEKGREQCEASLGGKRGEAFDRVFPPLLVKDLERFTDLVQRCAAGTGAEAKRKVAADMLPVLGQRLREARLLKDLPANGADSR